MIITSFANYPRIQFLDEWTHAFENPLPPKVALKTLDIWAKANNDNRDLAAVQGRTPHMCLPSDNAPGGVIVYPGALRPNLVDYISYDMTDFLQAEGDIVWAFQYVLRECGKERVFALRPRVGEILTIPNDITNIPTQTIHLLIVNANHRAPLIADDYLRSMAKIVQLLIDRGSNSIPWLTLSGADGPVRGCQYSRGPPIPRVCFHTQRRVWLMPQNFLSYLLILESNLIFSYF